MKKLLLVLFAFQFSLLASAQNDCEPFRAYIINNEYKLFLRIDLCHENIAVPGQELLGKEHLYYRSGREKEIFPWLNRTSLHLQIKILIIIIVNICTI